MLPSGTALSSLVSRAPDGTTRVWQDSAQGTRGGLQETEAARWTLDTPVVVDFHGSRRPATNCCTAASTPTGSTSAVTSGKAPSLPPPVC